MGLLPTNQRDQLMVIACVAALGLVGVYYMYLWSPKQAELATLSTRIDSLEIKNEVARREIARGTASRAREEAEEYGRMLGVMRQLVPTSNEVPALLEQISTAARRVGMDIASVDPLGIVPGDVFDTHKYKLSVTGSYHRIGEFLANVGSMTRIVAPMNLVIGPSARDMRNQRPRAGEQLLDASFEIQTYVAKTAPAGRPPVGAGSP